MAVASFGRYVLIFFARYLNRTILHCRLVHYAPLAYAILAPAVWYAGLLLFYPCVPGTTFNYYNFVCGGACYQTDKIWSTVDWILMSLTPVFLNAIINIVLLIQFFWQKRRLRQGLTWRKTRKMIIQLSAVVFLYLATQIPLAILSIVAVIGDLNDDGIYINYVWLYYLPYFIYLLSPFAYVLTTKECRTHIRNAISQFPTNQVRPTR